MTSSIVATDSVLTIDVGTAHTRAALFDVVGGQYRFIAAGTASTTIAPPFSDVREGATRAIQQLQAITGRTLIASDGSLLTPSLPDGSGVDSIATTLSAGPDLRVVAVGLLQDVSLQSALNLAATSYASIVETIHLNDRRRQAERIDAILRARPNLIIIAGGVEEGASHSIFTLLEAVGLASYLIPKTHRPLVIYAGNSAVRQQVKDALGAIVDLFITPNIRPSLNSEQLSVAQPDLAKVFKTLRASQMFGVSDLEHWSEGRLLPTATAFGRMVRFLGRLYDPQKAVLGLDIGATATTIAAGLQGELILRVFPQLGTGEKVNRLLDHVAAERIVRWIPDETSLARVLDFLANKAAYPHSLPASEEELILEQAVAREIIAAATREAFAEPPFDLPRAHSEVLPWTEPILLSGSVLSHAPTPGQALMIALDGAQPTGISTIVLDQNNLLASLGAAAEINSLLAVQVLESHAFINLGTVIAPVGIARRGSPVLRIRVTYENGRETKSEVKFGSLAAIPLPSGQSAQLHVQPLQRFDVGLGGPGRGGRIRVAGGALGIVIDARGRPLQLAKDPAQRSQQLQRWRAALDK